MRSGYFHDVLLGQENVNLPRGPSAGVSWRPRVIIHDNSPQEAASLVRIYLE